MESRSLSTGLQLSVEVAGAFAPRGILLRLHGDTSAVEVRRYRNRTRAGEFRSALDPQLAGGDGCN